METAATTSEPATQFRCRRTAAVREAAIAGLPGAKRLIRVKVDYIYYNCPRSVPHMEFVEPSIYAPREGYTPPDPEWKSRDYIRDILED